MDTAGHTNPHDNAHALSKGATIGLIAFTVIGCLVCIYVGLMIGEFAHL